MTINTPNELINYVKKHFDKLTDKQYETLLNNTLRVYPFGKPKTLNEAISTINEMSKIPLESRALFPDITEFDDK